VKRAPLGLIALVLLPITIVFGIAVHTPCDDAYIFLVYAKNLLIGNGWTFNGDRVEGFTSTLWLALVTLLGFLRVPLPTAAEGLSVAAAGVALLATYGLGRAVGMAPRWALLPPTLLAATGDFAFYAFSGLETTLFTALVASLLAWCLYDDSRRLLGSWRLPFGLLLLALTRPEGLMVGSMLIGTLGLRARSPKAAVACGAKWAGLLFPIVLAKRLYYGYWLPNTYYAKSGAGLVNLDQGIEYLLEALPRLAVVVVPCAMLAAYRVWRRDRIAHGELAPVAALLAIWLVYLAALGGDNMIGARMLVPVLPLLFVLAIKTLERFPFPLSAGGVAAASLVLAFAYLQTDRIQERIEHWRGQSVLRKEIGIRLRDGFPPGTLIATNAAGIIPYYSEQPTIDMLGLNDEDIAHRGKRNRGLRFAHQAGDGAYVLSRRPKVILLGPVGKRGPGKFVSDREIWFNPEFHASYRPVEIVPTRWAFVRKENAGVP
jgi:hypothetical protein